MNLHKITLTLLFLSLAAILHAQQIKDGETLDLDGIAVTFNVVNKETVDVKGQSYDRYKIVAAAQNNTGKSFNIRLKTYPDVGSIGGGKIVELNCKNATGARLTSKKIEVSMATHQLKITYLTKNNDGKMVDAVMTVPAGYFLDPGQKVENDGIFIVPKGEALQVSVKKLL